jgi:hypothetical protein
MTSTIHLAAVGDISLLQEPGKDLLRTSWDSAHIRIGNLESPFVDEPGAPADKLIRMKQRIARV